MSLPIFLILKLNIIYHFSKSKNLSYNEIYSMVFMPEHIYKWKSIQMLQVLELLSAHFL